jgi:hypothetical protein
MPAGFFEIRTLGKKIQLPINKLSLRVRVVYHMGRKEKFQYIKKDQKLLRAHDECLGANRR